MVIITTKGKKVVATKRGYETRGDLKDETPKTHNKPKGRRKGEGGTKKGKKQTSAKKLLGDKMEKSPRTKEIDEKNEKTKGQYKTGDEKECEMCGKIFIFRLHERTRFCNISCCIKYVNNSNEVYHKDFVMKELEDMHEELAINGGIYTIQELVGFRPYSVKTFLNWIAKFYNDQDIVEIATKIYDILERRKITAGTEETLMKWETGPDGEKIPRIVTINPSFMKFIMANHHGYKTEGNINILNQGNNQQAEKTTIERIIERVGQKKANLIEPPKDDEGETKSTPRL